ncbi:uncharacterized protein LOC129585060 [Paramacrobiotus metropolitanus]|uniref:uncharacterized protein LOC129585060 n=1 Tax=Paramacrobiotus metropolitanus TaxID=2943436 RepID=UPI0024460C32|nr:uncharacterized protein LOC129585060 [Paramacrobiotus metropolitanus]
MGGGMPKVPDYRIYKWERVPELVELNNKLAKHGLKDPWISRNIPRNEVWRWHPAWGTAKGRTWGLLTRGLLTGFILAAVSYGARRWYVSAHPDAEHWVDPLVPPRHHDDHGHGHGGHGHGGHH